MFRAPLINRPELFSVPQCHHREIPLSSARQQLGHDPCPVLPLKQAGLHESTCEPEIRGSLPAGDYSVETFSWALLVLLQNPKD